MINKYQMQQIYDNDRDQRNGGTKLNIVDVDDIQEMVIRVITQSKTFFNGHEVYAPYIHRISYV